MLSYIVPTVFVIPCTSIISPPHSCEFFKYWVEIVDMVIIIFALITTVINEVVLTDEGKNSKTRYAK